MRSRPVRWTGARASTTRRSPDCVGIPTSSSSSTPSSGSWPCTSTCIRRWRPVRGPQPAPGGVVVLRQGDGGAGRHRGCRDAHLQRDPDDVVGVSGDRTTKRIPATRRRRRRSSRPPGGSSATTGSTSRTATDSPRPWRSGRTPRSGGLAPFGERAGPRLRYRARGRRGPVRGDRRDAGHLSARQCCRSRVR